MPLINPGRGGFEDLRVHFLTEKEQQQKEKLLKDYLMLIEIPVIGLGCAPTQIITAARYELALAYVSWSKKPRLLQCSCFWNWCTMYS